MNKDPLNRNCFVRLYSAAGETRLPTMGMRELDMPNGALIFVPGERYVIYMNTTESIPNWTLTDGTNTYDLPISVTGVTHTMGTHSIVEIDVFPSGIPDGVYVMNIGSFVSNPVEVINSATEAYVISAFFRIGHNAILSDFYYPYTGNPNFRQWLRMRCSLREFQSEDDFEQYTETNTGQIQTLAGTMQEYVTFETYFSKDDHAAARFLSIHDNILINGRTYHRKSSSSYRVTPAMDTPLSTGEFSLYDTNAGILIRC